jgi:hypothetical protein
MRPLNQEYIRLHFQCCQHTRSSNPRADWGYLRCPAHQSDSDHSELGKKWTRRRWVRRAESMFWWWCQQWGSFRIWYSWRARRKVSSCSRQQSSIPVWQTFLHPLFLGSSWSASALITWTTTTIAAAVALCSEDSWRWSSKLSS